MTIKTINQSIRHQQNPAYDAQRLAALEEALAELAPSPEEYADDVVIVLRKFNPAVREIVVEENIVLLEIGTEIQEMAIKAKPSYADLFTALLAEVLKGG